MDDLGLTTRLADKGVGKDQWDNIVQAATGLSNGPMFDSVKEIVARL